jgi:hypothetical protein
MYDGDPALEYWKHLPTTWDDTRVINGDIGKSVCVARRKGREWYLRAIHADGRGADGDTAGPKTRTPAIPIYGNRGHRNSAERGGFFRATAPANGRKAVLVVMCRSLQKLHAPIRNSTKRIRYDM